MCWEGRWLWEEWVSTNPGTSRKEIASRIHHWFKPIKLHHMFINNAFVLSLFEGDLVQLADFRVAIV